MTRQLVLLVLHWSTLVRTLARLPVLKLPLPAPTPTILSALVAAAVVDDSSGGKDAVLHTQLHMQGAEHGQARNHGVHEVENAFVGHESDQIND
jgi:hypothetical protein